MHRWVLLKAQAPPPSMTLTAEAPPTGSSDQRASLHDRTRPQSEFVNAVSVATVVLLELKGATRSVSEETAPNRPLAAK